MENKKLDETVNVWSEYLKGVNTWQDLVIGVTPITNGCGDIYEIPNPIVRPQESFAVADMRSLPYTEPHYHKEIEIYFVLQGTGTVVVGGEEMQVMKDSVITIPPNTAHFTVPKEDLVLAVVNTPPYVAENYIVLREDNIAVKFDKKQFTNLIENNR